MLIKLQLYQKLNFTLQIELFEEEGEGYPLTCSQPLYFSTHEMEKVRRGGNEEESEVS